MHKLLGVFLVVIQLVQGNMLNCGNESFMAVEQEACEEPLILCAAEEQRVELGLTKQAVFEGLKHGIGLDWTSYSEEEVHIMYTARIPRPIYIISNQYRNMVFALLDKVVVDRQLAKSM